MKKIFTLLCMIMLGITLSGCTGKGCDLLILNWGDYISDELILEFEQKYNVTVNVATADSNEQMYQNIFDQFSEYDLVVPSDYMLDQLVQDEMLLPLDFSRLTNYQDGMFVDELEALMYSDVCKRYKDYSKWYIYKDG